MPERSVAGLNIVKSCNEIIQNFFSANEGKINNEGIVKNKEIQPNFIQLISKRLRAKEKYEKMVDSISDFNPRADPAIMGKAKLLIDPQEAYLAKIMMIRRAKQTIDLSYYIFHNDESGKFLLHEVRLAIKRGVKVRIMYDSLGSISNAPFYSEIKALGALRGGRIRGENGELTEERAKAEFVVLNPMFNIRKHVSNWYRTVLNLFLEENEKLPLTTFSMNRRSHDKVLMIDASSPQDSMAVIGGRNIANYYYGLDPDGKTTFQDLEIILSGVAEEKNNGDIQNVLENYYNKLFYYSANKNLENFIFSINNSDARKQFQKMRAGKKELLGADNGKLQEKIAKMEKEEFLDQNFEEGMVSIVNELQNFSRTKAFLAPLGHHNAINGNSLMGKLNESMRKAKKSIKLVSPYFWLSDDDINFLKAWLSEDSSRTLEVISNSISTTDNIPAQAMVDKIMGPKLVTDLEGTLIASQVKVYAYGKLDDVALGGDVAYGKLHAKFAIIDDEEILVGTSNLDPRSRYLNTELGVFFKSTGKDNKKAKELKTFFDQMVGRSYVWGSRDWEELRSHNENRMSLKLQIFAGKIINFFNLVPLI